MKERKVLLYAWSRAGCTIRIGIAMDHVIMLTETALVVHNDAAPEPRSIFEFMDRANGEIPTRATPHRGTSVAIDTGEVYTVAHAFDDVMALWLGETAGTPPLLNVASVVPTVDLGL